jgi:hypothetical protein
MPEGLARRMPLDEVERRLKCNQSGAQDGKAVREVRKADKAIGAWIS